MKNTGEVFLEVTLSTKTAQMLVPDLQSIIERLRGAIVSNPSLRTSEIRDIITHVEEIEGMIMKLESVTPQKGF